MSDPTVSDGDPSDAIYASFEALQEYLAAVRGRRAARREARRREIEASIEAVRAERLAAERDGDIDIAAELLTVEERFVQMLGAIAPAAPAEEAAAPPGEPPQALEPAEPPAPSAPTARTPTADELEELAERTRLLRERIEDFFRRPLTREDGSTDRSRLFRLRALAASVRALSAAAEEVGAADTAGADALMLLVELDTARPGANDRFASAPFTVQVYDGEDGPPTAEQWEEVARAYDATAEAQEVWEWFGGRAAAAGDADPTALLNAIAARQQILYRRLMEIDGDDELQTEFYTRLKDHAKRTSHYLKTLEQQCSLATLAKEAAALEERRAAFETAIAQAVARREAAERRESAIAAVEEWRERWCAHLESPGNAEAARSELEPLLRACADARVPPTNVRVREALLTHGLELLAPDGPFAKVREAVAQERRRRGLDPLQDAPPTDEAEDELDDEMLALAEQVAPHTRGKRVLILGGTPRGSVVDALAPLLEAEVDWEPSKKSDKAAKFRAAIERSDILLLVKNFAGHDMSEKGREWAKAAGGQFVHVTAGYGPKQLLHRLQEHFALRENGREAEA